MVLSFYLPLFGLQPFLLNPFGKNLTTQFVHSAEWCTIFRLPKLCVKLRTCVTEIVCIQQMQTYSYSFRIANKSIRYVLLCILTKCFVVVLSEYQTTQKSLGYKFCTRDMKCIVLYCLFIVFLFFSAFFIAGFFVINFQSKRA